MNKHEKGGGAFFWLFFSVEVFTGQQNHSPERMRPDGLYSLCFFSSFSSSASEIVYKATVVEIFMGETGG